MSSIFIIKCIGCKVKFDQGDSQRRKCDECVRIFYNKSRSKWNKKRDIARRKVLTKQDYYTKCYNCKSEFKTTYSLKKYCSYSCRIEYWKQTHNINKVQGYRLHE